MNELRPSPIAFRILRWFCPAQLYEEIEGDLIQKFSRDVKTFGERRAKWRLLWSVIWFFRPGIILRNQSKHIMPMIQFQNNLKMAFRIMRKNKLFSSINVFGLSVSMAACLLIFQYAFFELSYDKQYSPDIYRVGSVLLEDGVEKYKSAITPVWAAPLIKDELPEVAKAVRIVSTSNWFDCTLATIDKDGSKIFNEKKEFYFVDPSFTSMFQIKFLKGDKDKVLLKPFSIVLSSSAAQKYFGDEDPLGKTLKLHGSFQTHDYTVTGVMDNFPINSHLDVNILASLNSLPDAIDAITYIQFSHPIDVRLVEQRMNELASRHFPKVNKMENKVILEKINSIHLHSTLQDQPKIQGSATTVYFLMTIGIVVLIMAWMNYFNLTTSRSIVRAKEVGIRKVAGATRHVIGVQFLTETFLMNAISFILAIILFSLVAPIFYTWIGRPYISMFPIFSLVDSTELTWVIGVFILGVFISGFFPAQLFVTLNPVKVLKGKWQLPRKDFSVRKTILLFQFLCTIVLAIVVLIFQQQFAFLKEQMLGIDIKRSIVLTAPANVDSTYLQKLSGFKDLLKSQAVIYSVATSTDVPGNMIGSGWGGDIMKSPDGSAIGFGINVIDPDFIKSYQLKLLAGRDFSTVDFPGKRFGDKLEPVIINRKGAEVLGHKTPEEAIGETIYWGLRKEASKCVIVGVIEEFHQESLRKAIQPMLYTANMGPSMTLKLTEGADKNIPEAVIQIKQAWLNFFPNNAFDYFLLEDRFNQQYDDDKRLARLLNLFCGLAFSISGLGLFGLSLFSINTRLKEISLRKVLGASVLNLIRLLTKEYLILILIASFIALPLAYLGVQTWLSGFAFRIQLTGWLFFIPVTFILIIALITVSSQALVAVLKNPVDNLKHE
ncbi:MAG: ABC transporter permease [Cyclobacteriaceae bacterium]|nr:ABC transporter permease [Cyclobacteriaceae bacterium]